MLILGIETATSICSIGIVEMPGALAPRGGASLAGLRVRFERARDGGLKHGQIVLPLVDECLREVGLDLEELDLAAVSAGPGSFTGLRVGLATAKGLVLGTRTQVVGVPTLSALGGTLIGQPAFAANDGLGRRVVCPCLDARRGEIYGAVLLVDPGVASLAAPGAVEVIVEPGLHVADAIASLALESAARVSCPETPIWFVGDGAERYEEEIRRGCGERARVLSTASTRPSGAAVASLGARTVVDRGADDVATLAPHYVRLSDAERNRARRLVESRN